VGAQYIDHGTTTKSSTLSLRHGNQWPGDLSILYIHQSPHSQYSYCERLFTAGIIVSDLQFSLLPQTVSKLLFLNKNAEQTNGSMAYHIEWTVTYRCRLVNNYCTKDFLLSTVFLVKSKQCDNGLKSSGICSIVFSVVVEHKRRYMHNVDVSITSLLFIVIKSNVNNIVNNGAFCIHK